MLIILETSPLPNENLADEDQSMPYTRDGFSMVWSYQEDWVSMCIHGSITILSVWHGLHAA